MKMYEWNEATKQKWKCIKIINMFKLLWIFKNPSAVAVTTRANFSSVQELENNYTDNDHRNGATKNLSEDFTDE